MAIVKVRYKGLSDIREMSKKDLSDAGVNLSGGLKWDHTNRNTGILIEDPSDRLLEILKMEGTFSVSEVGEGDNVEGQEIITGAAIDDTGSVVKDATNGQVTEKGKGESEEDPSKVEGASDGAPAAGAKDKTKSR